MVAPYSGDILAIVALSASDNSLVPSPVRKERKVQKYMKGKKTSASVIDLTCHDLPWNSTNFPTTPCFLNI